MMVDKPTTRSIDWYTLAWRGWSYGKGAIFRYRLYRIALIDMEKGIFSIFILGSSQLTALTPGLSVKQLF